MPALGHRWLIRSAGGWNGHGRISPSTACRSPGSNPVALRRTEFRRLMRHVSSGWGSATGSIAALGDTEPVIALSIGEDARAYPLRVLIWHEIANDIVGSTPVVVTY